MSCQSLQRTCPFPHTWPFPPLLPTILVPLPKSLFLAGASKCPRSITGATAPTLSRSVPLTKLPPPLLLVTVLRVEPVLLPSSLPIAGATGCLLPTLGGIFPTGPALPSLIDVDGGGGDVRAEGGGASGQVDPLDPGVGGGVVLRLPVPPECTIKAYCQDPPLVQGTRDAGLVGQDATVEPGILCLLPLGLTDLVDGDDGDNTGGGNKALLLA